MSLTSAQSGRAAQRTQLHYTTQQGASDVELARAGGSTTASAALQHQHASAYLCASHKGHLAATGWRRGEGGRAGYAHNATPERNHWLDTGTGSLLPHEAPHFGRLRLPQLGAGVSRNGAVKGLWFLRSLQPGHLTVRGRDLP